jgi:hypothetical protein
MIWFSFASSLILLWGDKPPVVATDAIIAFPFGRRPKGCFSFTASELCFRVGAKAKIKIVYSVKNVKILSCPM